MLIHGHSNAGSSSGCSVSNDIAFTESRLLHLECSEATMRARILKRGMTSGRTDDNEASLVKRFNTFHTETRPVLEYFDELNQMKKTKKTSQSLAATKKIKEATAEALR